MNLDQFMFSKYHATDYNCSHFVRDVWKSIAGSDLTGILCAWNSGDLSKAIRARSDIKKLEEPATPCIVLLQRKGVPPHAGIWIDGDLFHLVESGVRLDFFEVIAGTFDRWNFYHA